MAGLDELIDWIETNPPDNRYWDVSDWETNLTRSIPNWRSLIAEAWNDPHEWKRIEHTRPKRDYDYLCGTLVRTIGLELAKRWFYSDVGDQKMAVHGHWLYAWMHDNDNLLRFWSKLDSNMKDAALTRTFKIWPGQPLKVLEDIGKYKVLEDIGKYDEMYNWDTTSRRDRMLVRDLLVILSNSGYVPSPQIEQLRNTIEEAGDSEYLAKIDDMIVRREKACQSMAQAQHRIPCNPNRNERELIARLMEITGRSGYLPAALPPILLSSETPPLFVAYPELEDEWDDREPDGNNRSEDQVPRNRERRRPETVSIEELLGVYQPRQEQIIIYEKGIRWRGHRLDEEWLFAVVLIHEIGHWITHVLPKPGVPAWATDLYVSADINVHEGWAQLMTWWVADQVGGQSNNSKTNR